MCLFLRRLKWLCVEKLFLLRVEKIFLLRVENGVFDFAEQNSNHSVFYSFGTLRFSVYLLLNFVSKNLH